MESKNWHFEELQGWLRVCLIHRIDSFNFNSFKMDFEAKLKTVDLSVAFEVGRLRFLSLLTIKYLSEVSQRLQNEGRRVALIAPSEKLKRQIDIFANLKEMEVFRTKEDFIANRPDDQKVRGRDSDFLPASI